MTFKPEVRREGLTMREVDNDLVVYDANSRRAHRLNSSAASILQLCDGTRTVQELAVLITGEAEQADKEASVQLAVDDFAKAGLLAEAYIPPKDLVHTRRNMLKKAAMIAFALPIVESIFAPTPAQAGSYGLGKPGGDGGSGSGHDYGGTFGLNYKF